MPEDTPPPSFPTDRARVRAPDFPAGKTWLNCRQPITLADLKGKLVLLDFWSYCCINCLHVLADLEKLERRYRRELVVIGVHSGKFPNEKDADNLRQAVRRLGIRHPVVNDDDFAIWQSYTVKAWPTLVLIDPEGYIAGYAPGEGHYEMLDEAIGAIAGVYREAGLLDEEPLEPPPAEPADGTPLRFPGKVLADAASGRLLVADSQHHRILVCNLDGAVQQVIGSGEAGDRDGPLASCSFRNPQGMALRGEDLWVADTGNHRLRICDLSSGRVGTAAGSGRQNREPRAWRIGPARGSDLNSPWDLCRVEDFLFVAMAGQHRIWLLDLRSGEMGPFAGNGVEALRDGSVDKCSLAQPSGVTSNGTHLFVADSEASAIRAVPLDPRFPVTTVVGRGLFDYGDVDGSGDEVRLQHPMGVCWAEGELLVADTYNHKIKRIAPSSRSSRSWLGDGTPGLRDGDQPRFFEPSGLSQAGGRLYVADTNNHCVRVVEMAAGTTETLVIADS